VYPDTEVTFDTLCDCVKPFCRLLRDGIFRENELFELISVKCTNVHRSASVVGEEEVTLRSLKAFDGAQLRVADLAKVWK
jgi:hypothetical protein